jgi:hypothetical protein
VEGANVVAILEGITVTVGSGGHWLSYVPASVPGCGTYGVVWWAVRSGAC